MYYLVKFSDNTLDIVGEEDVVTPKNVEKNTKICVRWPVRDKKATCKYRNYNVLVLEISESKKVLEILLKDRTKPNHTQEEQSPNKNRSRRTIDEEDDAQEPINKKKRIEENQVELREDTLSAKSVLEKLEKALGAMSQRGCCSHEEECRVLRDENELLRKECASLKAQIASLTQQQASHSSFFSCISLIFKDFDNYLQQAKSIVEGLQQKTPSPAEGLHQKTLSLLEGMQQRTLLPIQDSTEEKELEEVIVEHPHLLYSRNSKDVTELMPGSNVYIKTMTKTTLKSRSKNASVLSRALMDAVFKKEAMLECSVKGGPAKGLGKPVKQREGLYPPAVNAIADFVQGLRPEKNWVIDAEVKDIIKAMGCKLCEMRSFQRKKADNPCVKENVTKIEP